MTEPRTIRQHSAAFTTLMAVQCIACAVILWHGIPFYRKLLLAEQQSDPMLIVMAGASAVVLQLAYWRAYALRDAIVVRGPRLLGYVFQFAGRLIFSFASAMFLVVFYVKFNELDLRLWKLALLLVLLFSLFCFTQQIEWVGYSMSRTAGGSQQGNPSESQ